MECGNQLLCASGYISTLVIINSLLFFLCLLLLPEFLIVPSQAFFTAFIRAVLWFPTCSRSKFFPTYLANQSRSFFGNISFPRLFLDHNTSAVLTILLCSAFYDVGSATTFAGCLAADFPRCSFFFP